MSFELSQQFSFDAAHTLHRNVPIDEFEASMRIHGHTYVATVTIKGDKGASGMLQVRKPGKRIAWQNVDLFYLREEINRVRLMLDHRFLDKVADIGPATLENLCVFIAEKVRLPVYSVTVARQAGDSCKYIVSEKKDEQ